MWIIQRFDVSHLSLRIAFFARWWGSRDFRDRNFYTAQGLSRMISASENSYWSKKRANPLKKLKGFTQVAVKTVRMAHHHHQWLCLAAWDQTFVRCFPVLARLLALVRRYHQVARCSLVPGCRSR